METNNFLNREWSRMAAFRLLSDCYFLPDPGWSEKLENLEFNMANVFESAVKFVQNMRQEFKDGVDLEPLKVDFSKLFVGPYTLSAAPYGSVYLEAERKMMGDSTLDVKNRYREAGLDTAKTFKDAPDHIAAELEFMYYLIYKEKYGICAINILNEFSFLNFVQEEEKKLKKKKNEFKKLTYFMVTDWAFDGGLEAAFNYIVCS